MNLLSKYLKKVSKEDKKNYSSESVDKIDKSPDMSSMSDHLLYEFEERAAIIEFEGGLTREQAEKAAMKIISKRDCE